MSNDAIVYMTPLEAVDFLHKNGVKIGRTKFYQDIKDGLVSCTSDKRFTEESILEYAQYLSAPKYERISPDEARDLKEALEQCKVLIDKLLIFTVYSQAMQSCIDAWNKKAESKSIAGIKNSIIKYNAKQKSAAVKITQNAAVSNVDSTLAGIALGIIGGGRPYTKDLIFLSQWIDQYSDIYKNPLIKELRLQVGICIANGAFSATDVTPVFKSLTAIIKKAGFLIPNIQLNVYKKEEKEPAPDEDTIHILIPKEHEMFDHPKMIDLCANFCFTGVFAFGGRPDCEDECRKYGGVVKKFPVKSSLSYLVIGSLANPKWALPMQGTKIEKALDNKRERCPTLIIHEDTWQQILCAWQNNEFTLEDKMNFSREIKQMYDNYFEHK